MKNLRKVLALVLAVATLMSFAAMANADYADAAKIGEKTQEAVELLTELKVVKGKTTTDFAPQDNVTREEMAKMIYVVLKKGVDDEGKLYAANGLFADVSGWSKGYVEYIGKLGIISGRANGKFDPKANVTGVEATKMLLGVLGYDAQNEGYQNNDAWYINIVERAEEVGLFVGTAAAEDPSVVLTRENAARMILNALEANMVKYSQAGTSITVNGVTFVTGAGEVEEVANKAVSENYADDNVMQLIEKYFPAYSKQEAYYNEFGQPGVEWYKDGEAVVTVLDTPIMTAVDTSINTKDIYKKVGKKGADINVKSFAEGRACTADAGTALGKNAYKYLTAMTATNSKTIGTNGAVVEIYWDGETVTSVIFVERLGIISEVVTTSGKEAITVKKWAADADYTADGWIVTASGTFADDAAQEAASKALNTIKTKAYKKDDVGTLVTYRLGTVDGDLRIIDVEPATLKRVVAEGGNVYQNGTVINQYFTNEGTFKTAYANAFLTTSEVTWEFGATYDLALNSRGAVIGGKKIVAGPDDVKYLYLIDTAVETATFGEQTNLAKVLFADGTEEIIETKADYNKVTGLYSYTVDKEVYTLKAVSTAPSGTKTITQGKSGFGGYNFNNKTLFVVETTVGSTKVVDVYTGIRNVPSIKGDLYYAQKDNLVTVVFAMNATEITKAASTELDISVLYVPTTLHKITKKDAAGNAYDYHEVAAYINGTKATLKVTPAVYTELKAADKNAIVLINSYTLDENGVVCAWTEATENLTYVTMTKVYKDGLITLKTDVEKTEYVDADVAAYIYDTDSKAMETHNVTKLKTSFKGWVLRDADGFITAIYGTDTKIS